jgi:UDP-3-O-[3-hydroxymyristoyl] glucosamine N-acyltransferase
VTSWGDEVGFGVNLPAPRRMDDLVREHGGVLDGELGGVVVRRIAPPGSGLDDDALVLVTSARHAASAGAARGVLLCQSAVAVRCPRGRRWVHEHAMYVVAKLLGPVAAAEARAGISPSASVASSAEVDPTVTIGARAVILAGARVGAHTTIGEGAVIYGRVQLGERVTVGPLAVVGRPGFGWATGPSDEVVRVPQLGGVVVEDDVEIGALCTVDAGTLGPTVLRRGVKLDAHVHVAHNVVLGEATLVAAQSGFAGSAQIGPGVLVGGQVGVTDHARVGAGARIAGKSGVIGDVAPGAIVAGFPAIPRMEWLRAWARILGVRKRSSK